MTSSFYFGYSPSGYDDSELKKTDSYLKTSISVLNTETSSLKSKASNLESETLKADGSVSLSDDLDMGDNAIIGIEDINALNSVSSKKYIDDENTKQNTKITKNASDISTLKRRILYSHYSKFNYQNPTSGVFVSPYISPAGFPEHIHFLSSDFSDKTNIRILGLICDSDTSISGSSLNASFKIKFFNNIGGHRSKSVITNRNIANDRINSNQFVFDDISLNVRTLFPSHYTSFKSFQIKIAVPWNGNESSLYFSVDY